MPDVFPPHWRDSLTSPAATCVEGGGEHYRGSLALAGTSPNLPDENFGDFLIGQALAVGDYWVITSGTTLDDGSNTLSVQAGQILIVESATPTMVSDFRVAGISGAGATEDYVHNQAVAAAVWTINHNFGVNAEEVNLFVDIDGTLTPTSADWVNTDVNTTTVTFAIARAGYAIVEKPNA